MGDVVAAVDRYQDIPMAVRNTLKARMAARRYDEIVSIRRDAIVGKARYAPAIRQMHFGSGQVCASVDRSAWTPSAQERGLVYCEAGHCILVPTVCRNVSRITRVATEAPAVAGVGATRPPRPDTEPLGLAAPDSDGEGAAAAAPAEPTAALPLSQAGAAQSGDPGTGLTNPLMAGPDPRASWIEQAGAQASLSEASPNRDRWAGLLGATGTPGPQGLPGLLPAPVIITPLPITSSVPEPGGVVLLLAGLLGLGLRLRSARPTGI